MRKTISLVMCFVLTLVFLTPSVYASAPDQQNTQRALTERVKQELVTGNITEPTDVFMVAYEHLNADISEDGMTAEIGQDGNLSIIQVVKSGNARSASSGANLAVTSMVFLDSEGKAVTDYDYYYNALSNSNNGGLDEYMVYAGQTAYYNVKANALFTSMYVQLSYMVTTIAYGSGAFSASKLVQSYEAYDDFASSPVTGSKTTYSPAAGSYKYSPSGMLWYCPTSGDVGGGIYTMASVTVANTGTTFNVMTVLRFADIPLDSDSW